MEKASLEIKMDLNVLSKPLRSFVSKPKKFMAYDQ